MKKSILIIVTALMLTAPLFGQYQLGEIKKGTGERITFNLLSIVIPEGWNYSVNPKARPGTDQLQLFSDDTNRTLMITVTFAREGVDFIEAERYCRMDMTSRAASIPGFQDCIEVGSSQNEPIWGRIGIFTKAEFFSDGSQTERMMLVYNYGEELPDLKEVLFIHAFIIGEDNEDLHEIVRSLELLPG